MTDDTRSYLIDPATGRLVEGRWVCPNCKTVNVGPRCVNMDCGWVMPDDDDADTDLESPFDDGASGEQT